MITYRFGVYGENGGANFALLARSGGGQSLIVDNVPTVGQVFAGETALYKIHVPATASTFPQLYVTALQGSVRVLMSVNGATPIEASHAHGATAAPEWPARLPLSPGALNIVAVSHFSASAASFATFSLLAVVEPGSSALLLDGWPQSLEVQSGEAAFMRFIIPSAGQKVVLTARLADHASPRSTLSLRASALDPRAQHLLSCTGRDCHSATSPPGADSVSLVLQEDACSSRCLLHIALSSSDAANVTVIASTQTGDVQLQLGIPGCSAVRRGQLSHFSVLLDPDDDADDYLRLQLSVCSGNAELWAKLDAPVSIPSHDFTSSPPLLQPIVLQPSNLAGRSKVFAAIHGKDSISSTFCLDARPANEYPAEYRLSKTNGALTLSNDGKLAVHIMALVPLAGEVALAGVSADPRAVTYEVWTAFNTSNLVFTSWCGIEQSQGQQLLSVRGSELARPGPDGKLVLPLPVPKQATPGCNSSCGLVFGQVYLLSVVAVYQPNSSALPARFIYQSVAWRPGSRHGGKALVAPF